MRRLAEVDKLRGLAILMVVWHHICNLFINTLNLPSQVTQTWSGVDLFFVISGFVVSQSLLRLFTENQSQGYTNTWILFLKKRFTRILPVAWLWVLIPVAMTFIPSRELVFSTFQTMVNEGIAVLVFGYNYLAVKEGYHHIFHFWTLAVEEHFYFLLPLVYLFTKNKKALLVVFFVLLAGQILVRNCLVAGANEEKIRQLIFLSHFRFDGLILGVILFLLSDQLGFIGPPLSVTLGRILGALCAFILITTPGEYDWAHMAYFGFLTLALSSAVLVWLASLNKGIFGSTGAISKLFEYLGTRSYSLYLINMPSAWVVLEARSRWQWPMIVQVAVFLALSLFVTEINFRLVEKPLMNKSKLIGLRA